MEHTSADLSSAATKFSAAAQRWQAALLAQQQYDRGMTHAARDGRYRNDRPRPRELAMSAASWHDYDLVAFVEGISDDLPVPSVLKNASLPMILPHVA